MSAPHFSTLVHQRPPGGVVNTNQLTTVVPQHIIVNNVYKGPTAATVQGVTLSQAQQPRNGVKVVGLSPTGHHQQIQYQVQHHQQMSPPRSVVPQDMYNAQRPPIFIETSVGGAGTTTLLMKQQSVITSSANLQHLQSPQQMSAAASMTNGTLLQEIKTEPVAFSPSSPSSIAPPLSVSSPQQPQSPQDWKPQKKVNKGPTPRPQEELCLVCGDRASGYHYCALACEGCKGFFRRSITRNASYACKYGDQCEIDMYMRRKCQACRLKKCYTVGMKPECVVPEQQCKNKRDLKEKKKQEEKGTGQPEAKRPRFCQNDFSGTTQQVCPRVLLPEEEELINRVVFFQREFESPSENDLGKVYHVPGEGSTASESEQLFRHMTEMTILTVQLIVDFSKHLPGFKTLCRDDQVVLLKGCSSEVMMLRGARKYDPMTDSIVFATNHPFTKENYVKAGIESEGLFRFCRRMTNMKVDNAEFALVTAIDIFSERHGLVEPRRVEKIQEIYVQALHSYVMGNRRAEPMVMFSKLLSVLTDLRSLGYHNSQMCIELRMEKNKKLPDFLEEIWDLK